MERLRTAIICAIQQEADTWAAQAAELHDETMDLVTGFNECFPDNQIDVENDVTWHG